MSSAHGFLRTAALPGQASAKFLWKKMVDFERVDGRIRSYFQKASRSNSFRHLAPATGRGRRSCPYPGRIAQNCCCGIVDLAALSVECPSGCRGNGRGAGTLGKGLSEDGPGRCVVTARLPIQCLGRPHVILGGASGTSVREDHRTTEAVPG